MNFLDSSDNKVKTVPEEKPQRVARVNPDVTCGDCIIPAADLKFSDVPPTDRVVVPGDIVDINNDDDYLYIIGTKDGKVTRIEGLQNMKNLKVTFSSLWTILF